MTAAAHNMLRCLSHAEKASGRSFCSPYGAIVLVMLHNAPPHPPAPAWSLLLAPLLENKLLVSQRRAGGPWTHKCVRCGAPMRVAGRFNPTAGDKPAGEVSERWRRVSAPQRDVFEKFVRGIFVVGRIMLAIRHVVTLLPSAVWLLSSKGWKLNANQSGVGKL